MKHFKMILLEVNFVESKLGEKTHSQQSQLS